MKTLIIKAVSASQKWTDVLFGLSSVLFEWEPLIYIKYFLTILEATVCGATKETSKKEKKKQTTKQRRDNSTENDLSLVAAVECACPSLLQLQNILALEVGCPTAPFSDGCQSCFMDQPATASWAVLAPVSSSSRINSFVWKEHWQRPKLHT